jgi:hypothetical protein
MNTKNTKNQKKKIITEKPLTQNIVDENCKIFTIDKKI